MSAATPSTAARQGIAAAGAALTLALVGCSSDPAGSSAPASPAAAGSSTTGSPTSTDAPILQPGRPGEEASTIGPEDAPSPDSWNHTDVAFVQMMIPHHGQALEMSELAEEHAVNAAVRTLAERIRAAQGPEILAMAAWLEERDLEVPTTEDDPAEFDHGEHGHTPMTGMLTADEMAELAEARGRRFDRLFLDGMIRHHQGAVEMADSVALDGGDQLVQELAADVSVTQLAEMDRMRQLLGEL